MRRMMNIIYVICGLVFSSHCYSQETISCDSIFELDSINTRNLFINYESIPKLKSEISCDHQMGINGRVVIKLIVDTFGFSRCPRIIYSTNPDLNSTAIECAQKLIFEPAVNAGKKVFRVYRFPIVFKE